MRIVTSLLAMLLVGLVTLGSRPAAAAGPNITILRPADGATVQGTTLTVSVNVTGFRLVAPVFKHPPVLTGFAGSLQYILDSTANYRPRRDLSAATTHSWSNVRPGHHTIIVRLATSQHLPWPNGPVRTVSVIVARAPARGHAGGGGAGVSAAPSTGGAADITHSSLTLTWLLAALLILIGVVLLSSRWVLAPAFGRRRGNTSRPNPADLPAQALSVLPGEGDRPDSAPDQPGVPTGGVFPADDALPVSAPGPSGEPTNTATPAFPPAAASAEPSAASFRFDPEPAPAQPQPPPEPPARDRAIEMARQWSGVVESLVRQLDEQEAERRRMLEHIRMLEDRIRQTQATREHLRVTGGISADDLHSLMYLTDALKRDPDHIVNLAAIAQNAGKFHELVDAYTRLREAISEG